MGSSAKYEIDRPSGRLRVDRVLGGSAVYPTNYGFIPRTYCADGGPLDVLVLCSEPVVPLAILVGWPIGLVRVTDGGFVDDKVIVAHLHDPAFADYRDIGELPAHVSHEVMQFFATYKMLEQGPVEVHGTLGHEAAERAIDEAIDIYRREEPRFRQST
jgi:inorganic pyrophosphatase